ncbi:S-layer homology domain-containing protein [Paenibacillus sp. GSMTC-2017]|uniref:S-layer homology domain-containing protein n=1 Tax=Paenibacillus sp. GSMTC-2017 TaxID=2794350 RepID=UPI0018D7E5D7|nr:S-layer homology domain-containing protein [Paenibacillus sp. GSMTC-2017]MBH5318647.1 S-layer homology domain-containing protein [Paenibacillus sp. GSMTC-2017]
MKRLLLLMIGITLFWASITTPITYEQAAAAASATAFRDTKGHWAEKTIDGMITRGILEGYPDGTFQPNATIKVDQFVKMLILSYTDLHQNGSRSWNAKFLSSLSPENQAILKQDYRYFTFTPSASGYWAKEFIDIASDLHFLNKSRYTDFQADMTRENVAEVIYYTLQETEFLEDSQFGQKMAQSYGDIKSATEREQRFIAESLVKGIMEGYPNGFFGVGEKVTRAQALVLLERLTNKSKRIPIKVSPDKLERIVPTSGGGSKIIVFPDKRMWDAYETLLQVGQLRGTNHDLFDTTLRLYKDKAEKDSVFNRPAGSTTINEEAAIWLDPQYNTYGITMRLRDGSLARNKEVVEQFANSLFGYNAITFKELFSNICAKVEKGEVVTTQHIIIGNDAVNVLVDSKAKSVIFSIATKK